MENENNETIIDSTENNEEIELDLDLTEETPAEETPMDKPKETPEAKLARLKRQTAQLEKHLGLDKPKSESPVPSKSSDLGYAEKAFLIANQITVDEIPLAQEVLKKTGMTLDELVSDDYFKSKLKDFRDNKASKEAVPTGTKRSANSPKDSVDYWLKKPFSEVPKEMQIQVVNRRLEMEKSKNPFS